MRELHVSSCRLCGRRASLGPANLLHKLTKKALTEEKTLSDRQSVSQRRPSLKPTGWVVCGIRSVPQGLNRVSRTAPHPARSTQVLSTRYLGLLKLTLYT